jgi:bifunctional UDP-N-acetylglucosamine pyrophosphorylase/glucosamine-1-phosphate N-acetyltransferase
MKVIILAAGKGTRFFSDSPKILHKILGKEILSHAVDTAINTGAQHIFLVLPKDYDRGFDMYKGLATFVEQKDMQGTAGAVKAALEVMINMENNVEEEHEDGDAEPIIILNGDCALINDKIILDLLSVHRSIYANDITIASTEMEDPKGYGRIIREKGSYAIKGIVEERDANKKQRAIKEVNTGLYIVNKGALRALLPMIDNNNSQNEYYFTDIIKFANETGAKVSCQCFDDCSRFIGINTRLDLWRVTKVVQKRINKELMLRGVTMIDPDSCYIDQGSIIDQDVYIAPNVTIEGCSYVGKGSILGENTKIVNSSLGYNCTTLNSVILESKVYNNTTIGPFAYIRPNSVIGSECRIGDFVEIKNSNIGDGTKVSHLTYVGDSDVGTNVNFGCGSIIVNYDGKIKSRSVIGNDVFIGCNTNIISPVNLDDGSYTAAGSTITESVPKNTLAIARAKQINKPNWKRNN